MPSSEADQFAFYSWIPIRTLFEGSLTNKNFVRSLFHEQFKINKPNETGPLEMLVSNLIRNNE